MTHNEIADMAKKAEAEGDNETAVVLFVLAGAKAAGLDREIAEVAAEVAKNNLKRLGAE